MSNWLNDFLNSLTAKRIITANYVNHLRLKNEGRDTYANIEDALQDFAGRTGLNEMQKRALRRQVFVKLAVNLPQMNFEDDKMLFENGNAPAAIFPGVKPGSEKAKILEKTRKKPFNKLTDIGHDSQQTNRDVEDNAQQKSPGSPDTNSVENSPSQTADYKAGIVIEAADEWESLEEKAPKQHPSFKFVNQPARKPQGKRPGQKAVSKERRIFEEIRELQVQLRHLMKPEGTISKPVWRDDLSVEERHTKHRIEGQITLLVAELEDLQEKRKEKEGKESVKHKIENDNTRFVAIINKILGAKNTEERKVNLKKLSPEGLQDLFNKAITTISKDVYRRPSQGTDPEHGDYVKCMVCDKHGKTWISDSNPGMLPFSHIETHANELLSDVDLLSSESSKYREELIDAYLRKFPGASLQSREQELAVFTGRMAEKVTEGLAAPHVATQSETKLNYTDDVLLDMILYQFRRFGVDPDDRTLDDLAKEALEEIKARLEEEFPNSLVSEDPEGKTQMHEIGYVADKQIPFEALHRAFREEVGRISEEYRGTFSDFKPLTKRPKRRWTGTERQEARKEWFKQLRVQDIEQELATELGHWPTPAELAKKLRELDMIQVGISVTGGRGCWNCGNTEIVLVDNKRIAINSASCSKCGVYREVQIKVSELDWEQRYVIRDTNENDPGGPKHYIIWEDSNNIGNGPNAIGNSRFVHVLGRDEQEIRTRVNESTQPEEPGKQIEPVKLEVGTPVYSQQYKHGRIRYVVDGNMWVFWEDPQYQRTVKLKDLKGEVINLQSSSERKTGYYLVENVEIDNEAETVTVSLKSATGLPAVRQWNNLMVLENDIPVGSEVDSKELEKVEYASRRLNRERVLTKMSQEKKARYVPITVDRIVKTQKPVKQMPLVSRIDLLKRKIKRSSLIKRLLGE